MRLDLSRLLTAPLRALPSVVIIGAMKSGTSSLYAYLEQHPDFIAPRKKELHYWERGHLKPRLAYRAEFPRRKDLNNGRITGEASPGYLYHPHVARALARAIPDVRLIAILRDPVTRAYSHWRHNVRRRVESLSFADAIMHEGDRAEAAYERLLQNRSYVGLEALQFGYVHRGYYARHVRRYLNYFASQQLLVLRAEDLFEEPPAVANRCFRHIGLRPYHVTDVKPRNTGRRGNILDEGPVCDSLYDHFRLPNKDLYQLLGVDPWWPDGMKH